MVVIRVDALDDPRLADYASVTDERRLAARGVFVAEGRFVVQRLLEAKRHAVCSVLLNEAALAALSPALAGLEAPIYVCAPRFFEGLTGHHFHRGCLALAARPTLPAPLELARAQRSLVVLERAANADNVGSVFRSALALGVGAVWLGPGSADPLSRKAIRTSMAATLTLPFSRCEPAAADPPGLELSWLSRVIELRSEGFQLLALSPREPGLWIEDFAFGPAEARFALLVGAEGEGLSPELEALAHQRLRIAMSDGVDSLNLGVATGIALHWLRRAAQR
jgi:tRNA G18 (ribose-2'-O)-methylase SpoU